MSPEFPTVVLCILGLLCALIGFFYSIRLAGQRQFRRQLAARTDLAEKEFYEEFYGASGIKPEDVFLIYGAFAEYLSVPKGKLRPNDRFLFELKQPWIPTGIVFNALAQKVLAAIKSAFPHIHKEMTLDGMESTPFETLDSLVRFFADQLERTRSKGGA